jgi:hypothetical protein
MLKVLATTTLVVLAHASTLHAQVELGAIGGFYAATADFATGSTTNGLGPNGGKQKTALAYGALARLWATHRLGIEAMVIRAASDVSISPPFGAAPDSTADARLTIGTLAVLLRFPLGDLSNVVWADAGATLVSRAGAAYRGYTKRSAVGATAGLGTRFPLSGPLGIDIGVKGLFYSVALQDSAGSFPSRFQVDMVGWAGVTLRLGRERK